MFLINFFNYEHYSKFRINYQYINRYLYLLTQHREISLYFLYKIYLKNVFLDYKTNIDVALHVHLETQHKYCVLNQRSKSLPYTIQHNNNGSSSNFIFLQRFNLKLKLIFWHLTSKTSLIEVFHFLGYKHFIIQDDVI